MNDIRKFPDTAEEPTWMTVLSLLESTNAYDEQKFIAIWKDLSMEAQLSVLSYKWGRPNLLINASEELCMALLNSKYTGSSSIAL